MTRQLAALCLCLAAALAHPAAGAEGGARILVLVRHGHYLADPSVDEKLGPGLSLLGLEQAKRAGARLSATMRFDALHVSPMQRATDTAAALFSGTPQRSFEVIDDLAECTPPTRRREIMADTTAEQASACKAQLERLFGRFFRPVVGADRVELFVGHGNVIRYLVTRALGVDSEAWLEMSVGHASITRIRVEADGRFKVIGVGDVGHLPAEILSGASGDPEPATSNPPPPSAALPAK
jgi:serine/threonine-protein phosphatase PGAM5